MEASHPKKTRQEVDTMSSHSPLFYVLPGLAIAMGLIFAAAGIGDIANYGGGVAAWLYTIVGLVVVLVGAGVIGVSRGSSSE